MGLILAAGGVSAADLSLYGSYWNTDELDDTLGIGARVRGGLDPLSLELRGSYFGDLTEDKGIVDVELECVPVDVGLSIGLITEEKMALYLSGGGTYYFLDTDTGQVDDEIGWYAGLGGEFHVDKHFWFFVEYLYRDVEATVEDDDIRDIHDNDVAVNLAGSTVNIGIILR